jgi:hypothetical protein
MQMSESGLHITEADDAFDFTVALGRSNTIHYFDRSIQPFLTRDEYRDPGRKAT